MSNNPTASIKISDQFSTFWSRPRYAGEIRKRTFIPTTVRPTVRTNPSRKRSLTFNGKRFSNRRNLKTLSLHFSLDGTHFENGALRKR